MKNLIALTLAFVLCGCATLPSTHVDNRIVQVQIIMHDSVKDITIYRGGPEIVRGYQYWIGDICHVHFVRGDYHALSHEVAHCYYGSFHD